LNLELRKLSVGTFYSGTDYNPFIFQ
jgi:hypothetical protein